MFSLNNLKAKLVGATTAQDVLQAFMDARAYGFGDTVFVTVSAPGTNYPENHVMFRTTRLGNVLNDRLVCMFTVIGTIDGVEHTYLGFNPYGGNGTDMLDTMSAQVGGTPIGTIVAQALGYEDFVIVGKVDIYSLFSGVQIVIGAEGSTLTSRDAWFSSFVAEEFPSNHWVSAASQIAANEHPYDARIIGWDQGGDNHLCVDLAVRSTDDQNVTDLMGVIQKAALADLADNTSDIGDVTDDLASEVLRATTAEQTIVAAFEDTCAFGPSFKDAANAVIQMRQATGYIPRP